MVIPFLILFCIFPSRSSVFRPPKDRIVVSQHQVQPLNAARVDVTTRSSDEASDLDAEEEATPSILDEPDFVPRKARKRRGGKKHVAVNKQEMVSIDSSTSLGKKARKHRKKRESGNPTIIGPLIDKKFDEQTQAEDIEPETSVGKQKISNDEDTISDTAVAEETSLFGKKAVNQDDKAAAAATSTGRRGKEEEEEEDNESSPSGKEFESSEEDSSSPKSSSPKPQIEADDEDPASPKSGRSKKKGVVDFAEFNAAAAGDAVFFPDMEKTNNSIADAEAKVPVERKKKPSKAKEMSSDLLLLEDADEEIISLQSLKTDDKSLVGVESDGGEEDLVGEEDAAGEENFFTEQSSGKCRYHQGKWSIDSYEDSLCTLISIDDQQVCARERNETKPLIRWRWQPSDCKVEPFKAKSFFKMMQRKSLAFVGDKLAKAQMESLLCLLAQVEKPNLIYEDKTNKSSAWHFSSSNVTISLIWSPHLVQEVYENGYKKLHLDRLDTTWAFLVPRIDVLILGVGSGFIEPAIYMVHNEVVGCSSCKDLVGQNGFASTQEISVYSGFRATMRSAIMGVGALPGFEGITLFLQPYGFEGNGSYHLVSKKMKDIQMRELYHAYKRGSISNQSKMEVLHTDFISMSKHDNKEGPTTPACLVPSPLTNTWNEYLQHTLASLSVS